MEPSERKRIGKTVLWTVVVTLVVILAVVLIVPYTGAIDVAATQDHLPGVHWYLETTQARSAAADPASWSGIRASPSRRKGSE